MHGHPAKETPTQTMRPLARALTVLPSAQHRDDRYFYLWYDGLWALGALAWITLLRAIDHAPLLDAWDARVLWLLPLAMYAQILCSAWIHNAAHGNFPRAINRAVGEILGAVVLTRFASWEIVHHRHHRFSDDPARDPHPVQPGYWRFTWHMIVNVERQLQRASFERWGDTAAQRRFERLRATMSFGTGVLLLAAWHATLGTVAFFGLFVPATAVGVLHLAHFNWSTHGGPWSARPYRARNLDHGLYRVGNVLWHGIYFHANHHRRPGLFDPRALDGGEAVFTPDAPPR